MEKTTEINGTIETKDIFVDTRERFSIGFRKENGDLYLLNQLTNEYEFRFFRFMNISEDSSRLESIYQVQNRKDAEEKLDLIIKRAQEEKIKGKNYVSKEDKSRNVCTNDYHTRIYKLKESIDDILENDLMIITLTTSVAIEIDKTPYTLYQLFDIKRHKDTFPYYTELVIDRDGNIYHATPSHQIFTIALWGVEKGILDKSYLEPSREAVMKRSTMAQDYQEINDLFDGGMMIGIDDIIKELGTVAVYYHRYEGTPNARQLSVLRKLSWSKTCAFDDFLPWVFDNGDV